MINDGPCRLDRRTFLAAATASAATALIIPAAARAVPDGDLTWLPAWMLRDMIARKQVSSLEVTNHFLKRIERLEPKLHMFRGYDVESARAQARAADKAVAEGRGLGLLHGVPTALKEHISVAGMPYFDLSLLGVPQPKEKWNAEMPSLAKRDSVITERLRAAGAVIVGVTIMPGLGEGPGMPSLEKHPRNPWDVSRVPGGSSAGSAAVVASGALPFAIGTDGQGSLRLPAALSGLIGVHTTPGRLPGISETLLLLTDTLGPLTRDAQDAALVLKATAGPDGRDMLSTMHGPAPDYLIDLERGAKGMRIAWTDDYGFTRDYAVPQSESVISAVRKAAQGVTALGAALVPTDERWESPIPYFPVTTACWGPFPSSPRPSSDDLTAALAVRKRNRDKFDRLFQQYDVLMSPTVQFTAPTVEEWNTLLSNPQKGFPAYTAQTAMFNWLQLPAISVPCGFLGGLPIGVQLVGPPDSEPKLLRLAHAFLQRFPRPERPQV